jgi:potassium efflux system protein
MPGRTEGTGPGALVRALLLLALLALPAAAQEPAAANGGLVGRWDAFATNAEATIADPDTSTEALEALRERLVAQRGETLAAEQQGQPAVAELNQRLEALGPAPAEGADEAPEIASLRSDLQRQIAEAQAPVQAAQEAFRRTETLIGSIDRTVRARFSAELMARGASPLLPSTWKAAADELLARLRDYRTAVGDELDAPLAQNRALLRVPVNLVLIGIGLAVAFAVRRWTTEWVEQRLVATSSPRSVAWLVALRNLTRLVVPTVGAGLIFAAFDPEGLLARADEGRFFSIPNFVLVLIAAGWVSGSLLSPGNAAFRLVPLADDEARRATRLYMMVALAVALSILFSTVAASWSLSRATQSAMQFPLVLIGSYGLWRGARLIEHIRRRVPEPAAGDRIDSATTSIGLRFLALVVQILRLIAITAPLLAAAGYTPAAAFLVFRTAMTIGLLGAIRVVFDLLNQTARIFLASPTAARRETDGGLLPVVVAAVVGIVGLPFLAMIWGARPSDIADFWMMVREGVSFGGVRVSGTGIVTLIVVFAVGFGLTRLLQTVLRGTVLPRTTLDAGGRNAVLAGVGYIGFAAAALVAVSAAGLDLSSLAIVAGALSVGIGFGLQNVVSNFVSGIILLVERPVKEGDWIEVGGFSGYVKGINVRSTEIETFDRASVILPNSDLVAGTVLNRTHTGMSGRLQVPVSVTYDSDPKRIEAILLDIAEGHPLVLEEPAPRVLFLELGADAMNFELRCWLRDVNFSLSARSDMNFEIMKRFNADGIRTRFYGRDVPVVPEAEAQPPVTQPMLKAPEQHDRPPAVQSGGKPA